MKKMMMTTSRAPHRLRRLLSQWRSIQTLQTRTIHQDHFHQEVRLILLQLILVGPTNARNQPKNPKKGMFALIDTYKYFIILLTTLLLSELRGLSAKRLLRNLQGRKNNSLPKIIQPSDDLNFISCAYDFFATIGWLSTIFCDKRWPMWFHQVSHICALQICKFKVQSPIL